MILLEVVVVIVGIGAEFQLFNLDNMLFLLGFVLLLLLLVLVVSVIHGFGDRGHRLGETITRSSPISWALRSAAVVGMISAVPSGNTARTSRARMDCLRFLYGSVCEEVNFCLEPCKLIGRFCWIF